MMNSVKRGLNLKSLITVPLVAATLTLTGCLNNDDMPPPPPAGYVSIYQGAVEAPEFNVFANSNKVNNSPLKYSEGLPYQSFFPGDREFRFSLPNSATSLLEKEFEIEEDSVYTIFVIDDEESIDAIITEDVWGDPEAEEAQIRFVNLSPDAGSVSLVITGEDDALFEGFDFKSISDFESIEDETYNLSVISNTTGETLVEATSVELKGNRVYSLILRGMNEHAEEEKRLDLQLMTNYIDY